MSHLHRRRIRHHWRDLIATRRCMRVTLPSGRVIRGHMATRTETPNGTLVRWFTEGAKPGTLPYYSAIVTCPKAGGWEMRDIDVEPGHVLAAYNLGT